MGFDPHESNFNTQQPLEAALESGQPVSYTDVKFNSHGEVVSSQTMIAEPTGPENSAEIRPAQPEDFAVIAGPAVRSLIEGAIPDVAGVILNQKKRFDPNTGDRVGNNGTVIVDSQGRTLSGDLDLIVPGIN